MKFIVFLVCFVCVILFSSSLYENYHGILYNMLSIFFVFGGTLTATFISFPVKKIRQITEAVKKAYEIEKFDYAESTRQIIHAAREYKRLGFKSLEESSKDTNNPYLKLGFLLIADSCTWDHIKTTIKKEFIFDSLQNDSSQRIVRSMAKYAPAFGLAGTIVGLMRIFPQLSNPVNIGGAMSIALLTTLYGVLASNLVFFPIANKLRDNASEDEIVYRFVIEALHCINEKEYSIVIEQRLSSVMPKYQLLKYQSDKTESLQLRMAENS